MAKVEFEHGLITYSINGEIYYVKRHFPPTIPPNRSSRFLVHETFFSYGPIERIVSLLGIGRVNVVSVKLSGDMDIGCVNIEKLKELVGPEFYFSKAAYQYDPHYLPHQDPERAMGFQIVFDTLVRNWDDGERNIWQLGKVPIWFDFGASLDPRCQNIYRFLLKLQDAADTGRVSSIKRYFDDYTQKREDIIGEAVELFRNMPSQEIRGIVSDAEHEFTGYFAEYIAGNIVQIEEDIDILRGAFVQRALTSHPSLMIATSPRNAYWRQVK